MSKEVNVDGHVFVDDLGDIRVFVRRGNVFQFQMRVYVAKDESAWLTASDCCDVVHLSRPMIAGIVPLEHTANGYDEYFEEAPWEFRDLAAPQFVADRRVIAVCAQMFLDYANCLKDGNDPQAAEPVFGWEWVERPVPTREEAERLCDAMHIPNPLKVGLGLTQKEIDANAKHAIEMAGLPVNASEYASSIWYGCAAVLAAQKAAWVAHGPLLEMVGGKYDRIRLDEYRKLPKEDQAMIADPAECPLNAQSLGGDVFVYDEKTGGRWWFLDSKGRPCSHHMSDMWGEDVEFDDSPAGEETAYNDYVFRWPGHCSLGVAPKGYVYVPIPQLPGSEKGCSMKERDAELIAYSDLALKHKAEAETKAKGDADKAGEADAKGEEKTADEPSPKGGVLKRKPKVVDPDLPLFPDADDGDDEKDAVAAEDAKPDADADGDADGFNAEAELTKLLLGQDGEARKAVLDFLKDYLAKRKDNGGKKGGVKFGQGELDFSGNG